MKKIPTLFLRNHDIDWMARNEVNPGCEWIINGEGVATRKWDGSCCMARGSILYRRHEVKPGEAPPYGFEPAGEPDEKTGKQQGWLVVDPGNKADKWHMEALLGNIDTFGDVLEDGTYELVGPKVNGNHDGFDHHILKKHGDEILGDSPRDFEALKEYLSNGLVEGIVWHHPDGRMGKIKARDFDKKAWK